MINRAQTREDTGMTNQQEGSLLKKLQALPPSRIAEVEDFIDFLRVRDEADRLTHAATKLSEPAFSRIWDNPDDADYDRL